MIDNLIVGIFAEADELRVLLKLPEEETQVEVIRWHNLWNVTVRPSLMTFGTFTHMMQRGYNGQNLGELLYDALQGAKEELKLYKDGKTRGL